MSKIQQKLLEFAKSLPTKPGCYLMKNSTDEIIYVGKAKNLKSRVSSYFNNSEKNNKTTILVSHIKTVEFMVVGTDAEAYILENNLIKKHSPRYNIRLKDDKSYPYMIIDNSKKFPRIEYKRKFRRKTSMDIYGPFVSGSNISNVIKVLRKYFKIRDCSDHQLKQRKVPCLLHQMDMCDAPCVNKVTESDYLKSIGLIKEFITGKNDYVLNSLEEKMLESSEKEEFEKAASIRDDLTILTEFSSERKLQLVENLQKDINVDIISYYQGKDEVEISIYIMRDGILLGHKNFNFSIFQCDDDVEMEFEKYILQYYRNTNDSLPARVVLPLDSKKRTVFKKAINGLLDDSIQTSIQISGIEHTYKKLSKLVYDQAMETQKVRLTNSESVYSALAKLKELLGLKERPVVLECYDIAVWDGHSPTASQIVFHDGVPDKKAYRHYALETREEGNNDFAMMKEVLSRRIKYGKLPDVFIVDGGKGQVSSFQSVLREFGIDTPVAGIAKERTKSNFKSSSVAKTEERLIIPNRLNPYSLSRFPALFRIVVQMRDEAHRFSRRLHHKKELKRVIPGN